MKRYKVYTKEKGIIKTNKYSEFIGLNMHRTDGPAFICYYDNGNVEYEKYYVNGKSHKLDGPAYIEYERNGNIVYESYYIYGNRYKKNEYYNELLKLKVQSL